MADWTGGCVVDGVATLKGVECAVGNLLGAVLGLAGIVLFIMLIVGGFKYMTSRGDPKAVEAAKSALSHAIAGLVILVLAYVILLIIEAATGIPVTKFKVTQ
ncbi:MAG: hypothetical protein AAB599_00825 [Patescibacteria group bacterium]